MLAVLPAIAATTPSPSLRQIDIIHTGQFHGKEVSAQSGEVWAVLYQRGEGFELVSSTIRVDLCHDPILDPLDNPAAASGRSVSIDADVEPLVLVSGLENVGPTPVSIRSAESPDTLGRNMASGRGSRYLPHAQHVSLTLGGLEYRLSATGKYDPSRPKHDRLVVGYRLMLEGPGGVSQDLQVPARFAEDGMPVVLWAGDLDRDGRLDLYMDLTSHYNVRNYTLFLSSRASAGMLVKKVATRSYVGC